MLIKHIKIRNFRQFINESIEFSTDPEKNVTIIHGENGSGKTTLLQAFIWCFYGEKEVKLDYSRNMMLNKNIAMDIRNGQTEEIKIAIRFIHSNTEYEVVRYQNVNKHNEELKYSKSEISIKYKNKKGNWKYLEERLPWNFIESVFPLQLSSYFFFDGERIKNLGDNTREGKKDLKNAVSTVLNLDNLENASKHTKLAKNKITSGYSKNYNDDNNEDISEKIRELEEKIDKSKEEKKNVEDSIDTLEEYLKENSKKLLNFAEAKSKEQQRLELIQDIKREETYKNKSYNSFMKKFNDKSASLFAGKLFDESIKYLSKFELQDGIIEGIDAKAIDQILDKMVCLCGYEIKEGCEVHKKLLDLKKYLPPQSYGVMVNSFIKDIDRLKNSSNTFVAELIEEHKSYTSYEDTIDKKNNDIHEINDFMKNNDLEIINKTEQKSEEFKKKIKKLEERKIHLDYDINQFEQDIKIKKEKRDRLKIDNEKDLLIRKREQVVEELIEYFDCFLKEQQNKVKEHLQQLVSEIFSEVMHKEYFIEFDDKFNFSVKDKKGLDVPMSEGEKQVTSISFITGIVNMAKDKELNKRFAEKTNYEATEIYPVIMDSSFGTLDNIHRKNIAKVVPTLSDQTIVFVSSSQWEGEVEKAMKSKMGKEYRLEYIKSGQGDYIEESTRIIEEASYV